MKKGMIKVSVLYPSGDGKSFDMDYYCTKHVPLVVNLLGDALKGASIEKGVGGAIPHSEPPFLATGNMYFENISAYEASFGPNAEEILGDLPNFTNIEPEVLVSKVMV